MASPTLRVLVALDPNVVRDDVLAALACLGDGAVPELLGIYVEDEALIALGQVSAAREVAWAARASRGLDVDSLQRQLRAEAGRLIGLFGAGAARAGLRHSASVARGGWLTEVLRAAVACDALVLGHSRLPAGQAGTVRRGLQDVLRLAPATVLFVQERWSTGRRIAVLWDGSPAAVHAAQLAARLARAGGLELVLFATADAPGPPGELACRARRLAGTTPDLLARAVLGADARAICLPAGDAEALAPAVAGLLGRASCSVIVAR